MLQRYRVDVGIGVEAEVHVDSSSRSCCRRSSSCRAVGLCRMQLGKRHVGRQGRCYLLHPALCLWAVDAALEMSFNL